MDTSVCISAEAYAAYQEGKSQHMGNSSLSTGAWIGIGMTIAAAVVIMTLVLATLMSRRRANSETLGEFTTPLL